jgi:hypothetical protein
MIENFKIDSFIDTLNNELNLVNANNKIETDEKKRKILSSQSCLINTLINKLIELKNTK